MLLWCWLYATHQVSVGSGCPVTFTSRATGEPSMMVALDKGLVKQEGPSLEAFRWGRDSAWAWGRGGAGREGPWIWGVSLISSQMAMGWQMSGSWSDVSKWGGEEGDVTCGLACWVKAWVCASGWELAADLAGQLEVMPGSCTHCWVQEEVKDSWWE